MEFKFYEDTLVDEVSVPVVKNGDVLLVVNCFGLKTRDNYSDIYKLGIPLSKIAAMPPGVRG